MALTRRSFLVTTSLAAGVAAAKPLSIVKPLVKPAADLRDWAAVREQFDLDPGYAHLGLFYLASHPRPVREAIESYRRKLDANPFLTVDRGMFENPEHSIPERIAGEIAKYIGAEAQDIALTQNTTMGLSLVYHGLKLKAGDEILTT